MNHRLPLQSSSPTAPLRVRILVLGDDETAKKAVLTALCGAPACSTVASPSNVSNNATDAGVTVCVRRARCGGTEIYYALHGGSQYIAARAAIARRPYDAVLLVHHDSSSRTQIRRIWLPLAMSTMGDVKSLVQPGHPRSTHVRVRGVLNEVALLWRCTYARYVKPLQAIRDATRLFAQLIRLALHESRLLVDPAIDKAAEWELLAAALVPVAIVGVVEQEDDDPRFAREDRDIFVINTEPHRLNSHPKISHFLHRVADFARDASSTPKHRRVGSNASAGHVALQL